MGRSPWTLTCICGCVTSGHSEVTLDHIEVTFGQTRVKYKLKTSGKDPDIKQIYLRKLYKSKLLIIIAVKRQK